MCKLFKAYANHTRSIQTALRTHSALFLRSVMSICINHSLKLVSCYTKWFYIGKIFYGQGESVVTCTSGHIQFDPQYDNLSAYHNCFHSNQPIRDKYDTGTPTSSVPSALLSRNRLRQELSKNYSRLNS